MAQATLSCPFGAIHLEMRQGGAFDEHGACGSAHRRRPPGPPSTGAGNFGLFVNFGGLSFDRAPAYSRPTGAFCHQNLNVLCSNVHRLVPAYLLGAAVVGRADSAPRLRTSCHSYARAGGVIPTHISSNFVPGRGLCPRGKKDQTVLSLPAGRNCQKSWRASPVNGGLGASRL